jgi:hypothetical protein
MKLVRERKLNKGKYQEVEDETRAGIAWNKKIRGL